MISPDQLHHLFATYGLWTVGLIVALESLGVPLPGEAVLILASVYASTHGGNIALVIMAAALGAIIGDNIGYLIGRHFGFRLMLSFGPAIGISESRMKLGQYLFQRYGGAVVFFGRFFAVLRFLAAFVAGVNQFAWQRFLVANALGGLVWATIVGISAYTLGREIHDLRGPVGTAAAVVAAATLIAIFVYLRRHQAELQAEAEASIPGPLLRPSRR